MHALAISVMLIPLNAVALSCPRFVILSFIFFVLFLPILLLHVLRVPVLDLVISPHAYADLMFIIFPVSTLHAARCLYT